ncbi:hypothetical protein FAIPA1_30338 [Frankia sp. AiPs1]
MPALGILLGGLAVFAVVWWRLHGRSFWPVVWWLCGRARLTFMSQRRWKPARGAPAWRSACPRRPATR